MIETARLLGWRCAHFRPARTAHGWRTPGARERRRIPDLILARDDRLVAVELKADRGRLSLEQQRWLAALGSAGVEVFVWRPEYWSAGAIERGRCARAGLSSGVS